MYGGHITDFWDRRTNSTYLQVLFQPKLFNGAELVPCYEPTEAASDLFLSPDASNTSYIGYKAYIDEALPQEAPVMFGLHPNAEIGYLTSTADNMFETIVSLQGGDISGGNKSGGALQSKIYYRKFLILCPKNLTCLILAKERRKY